MKLFFIVILLIISTITYSNELKNYEFTYQEEDLIIAFTLDEEAQTEIFNLKNPFRLILTLKNTSLNSKIKHKNEINNEIIKKIMAVQFSRNGKKNIKIILSLKKEIAYTLDKFNNRILLILKNVKTLKQDKIAQKIEENEKKIIETPEKIKLKNMLTKLDYQYINEDLVISIKTNKPTTYKAFELVSPFRIFLDVNNVDLSTSVKKEKKYNDEYLQKAIINKMSRNGKQKVRVSLFFKDKKTYLIEQFKNNIVLTIKGAKKLKNIARNTKEKIENEAIKEIKEESMLSNERLIDYNYNDNSLLIAIKLKKDTELKSYNLTNPFRIIMDLKNTSLFKEKMKKIKYTDKYIKDIKFIKYKKNGALNTKVIILFNKYAPYQVEKINKTILITLSNIINDQIADNSNEITEEEKIEKEAIEEVKKEAELSNEKLIDYNYNDNSLLIAIKLKKDTELKSYNLTNPFRIIMDLKDISFFKEKMKKIKYTDKYIKDIKFIKYKKAGILNTKVIILFNKYAPYQIEKINKTILITLSNIINFSDTNNVSKNDTNNNMEITSDEDIEKPEETISFKKQEKQKELKKEMDNSLKNNDISLDEEAPTVKTTSSNISSRKHNILNKVVFKKYNNKARIIIKTKNPASYQTELEANTFSIILNNTSFGSRMASLTLNTEFFKTNVKKIIPKHKGRNIIIKLNLSKAKSPKIKQSRNQIFLDF